jgi:hypothetical protein
VRLATPCGEHFVCYPAILVAEAAYGVFYTFVTRCECGKAYLVETAKDGAHFMLEAEQDEGIEALGERYDSRPGEELIFSDPRGDFVCKRLGRSSAA